MWCYTLLPKIWNMSLTASVVILFVLLTRLLLFKHIPKVFSYVLWVVVLFRLLCPVSFSSDLSIFSILDVPVSEQNTMDYIPPNIVHMEDPEVDLPLPGVSETINGTLPYGEEQQAADPLEAPMAIATWIWLFGIAMMLTYSVVSLLRLRRKLVGSARLRDNIRLADQISSPFVMGLFRPKIYLPSSLPENEREYIILHEQYHIRRLDHVAKLLAFAALCIHWFNPLVWAAFILSGKDMEMSCDEAVLRELGPEIQSAYSQSLLSLATGRRVIAGAPLAFGEGDTKSRIKNVLKWEKPTVWVIISAVFFCAVVIIVCALNPGKNEPDEPADLYVDSFSFEALAPGEEMCYQEKLIIPWGDASLEYSTTYTRTGLTMEYGLRAADGTEYGGETVGGSAAGTIDGIPAGAYTLFVRSSETNAQYSYDLDMTGAFWFSYEKDASTSVVGGVGAPNQVSTQADPLDAAVSTAV